MSSAIDDRGIGAVPNRRRAAVHLTGWIGARPSSCRRCRLVGTAHRSSTSARPDRPGYQPRRLPVRVLPSWPLGRPCDEPVIPLCAPGQVTRTTMEDILDRSPLRSTRAFPDAGGGRRSARGIAHGSADGAPRRARALPGRRRPAKRRRPRPLPLPRTPGHLARRDADTAAAGLGQAAGSGCPCHDGDAARLLPPLPAGPAAAVGRGLRRHDPGGCQRAGGALPLCHGGDRRRTLPRRRIGRRPRAAFPDPASLRRGRRDRGRNMAIRRQGSPGRLPCSMPSASTTRSVGWCTTRGSAGRPSSPGSC